jgi:hypothetical protein
MPTAPEGPRIGDLRILVADAATNKELFEIAPGGTLTMAMGQEFRLRMSAVPADRGRGRRYPSTRFRIAQGDNRIRLRGADEKVGRVIVVGMRLHDGEPTMIEWQILDPLDLPDNLRVGRIRVVTTEPAPPPPPPAPPPPAPDRGVVLCEHENFRGQCVRLSSDISDLRATLLGHDNASSIRVDAGCSAILYDDVDFRGGVAEVNRDLDSLRGTPLGNDRASSLRVLCRRP